MVLPLHSPPDGLPRVNEAKPRIGVPYCSTEEEQKGEDKPYRRYLRAVTLAGGETIPISLQLSRDEARKIAQTLDGFLLPGSGADVNPELFGAHRHPKTAERDQNRERIDFTLLEHAMGTGKPVLGVCYGLQSLNVFLGGTLVQDIADELGSTIEHDWEGRQSGMPEPFHIVGIEAESELAKLAGAAEIRVNSSHHQSIRDAGRELRVVARAGDGVVEAVEFSGDETWIRGVQWHPERILENSVSATLFAQFVSAGRAAGTRI